MRPPDPEDWDRVFSGEIPWSLEELMDAIERAGSLLDTPHDDWDRRERGLIMLDGETGERSKLVFNPDVLDNQIAHFLMSRFRERGYDLVTKQSHLFRFMTIRAFLASQAQALINDGLVRQESDAQLVEVSEALLAVLTESRYDAVTENPETGQVERSFDYEAVVFRAKARDPDIEN